VLRARRPCEAEFGANHNEGMQAAGFKADDMHGFITVVPAGSYEFVYWQQKGYQ